MRCDDRGMRIGIGLPAAVPDADMTQLGAWAAAAERAGFASVGVIDRLIYDNLDPLTALSAAAATTRDIELLTTVANVRWRGNAVLFAKQLASVQRLSGGRLTAGLGMGGWPADYEASAVPMRGRGAGFDADLAAMEAHWDGVRPPVLLGGTVPAGFARAATPVSAGWVAPLFGIELLREGVAAVRAEWARAERDGAPRIATGRYFSLGAHAAAVADAYIEHYYGTDYFAAARADTLTDRDRIATELARLEDAGVDDVVLYPCSGDAGQIDLLAEALTQRQS
jgi:alkanesulfonate monooxygenase SsuD/methylene tetrahydromethanopterin reductase-like flavin-dependent oxidoreductase (luciferase family)